MFSLVGRSTVLQARRSQVQTLMRSLNFSNWYNSLSCTMAWGQHSVLREMGAFDIPRWVEGEGWRMSGWSLTPAASELSAYRTRGTSTACHRDSFTFFAFAFVPANWTIWPALWWTSDSRGDASRVPDEIVWSSVRESSKAARNFRLSQLRAHDKDEGSVGGAESSSRTRGALSQRPRCRHFGEYSFLRASVAQNIP
jgi:hypothetical protein